jgi:hypothetical protein
MDHEWVVEVKDDVGAAITAATVALVHSSALVGDHPFTGVVATHPHKAGGRYEAAATITPVEGDWTLIVRVTGKSPVVQPLKMAAKKKSTEFSTIPSPRTAATIAFTSEVKAIGTSKVKRSLFTVTMFKSAEVIFISGTEYSGAGTQFRIFAEEHRTALLREKKIDVGTIITIFSTDERERTTAVPAAGGAFLKVFKKSFGPNTGIKPGTKHAAVVGTDISMVDLYKYLSAVGAAEPGRVKEVSVFSHSWPGGPILFNTEDISGTAARNPNDFDGRMKDFNTTNVTNWPKMKDAMAAGSNCHIWGCSATTHHKELCAKALAEKRAGAPATKFFTVKTTTHRHGASAPVSQIVEEHLTQAHVKADMDLRFRSQSYMARAAAHLGIAVFGAPPGVGSSYATVSGLQTMIIDTVKENGVQYAYFKEEFSPEFAPTSGTFDTGYVDYRLLATRAPISVMAFSAEYYRFTVDRDTPAATVQFANGKSESIARATVTLVVTAKSGFKTAGKNGFLYELRDTADATKSTAVYLQDDGKLFRVTKGVLGNFTVPGSEI